jgi:malonate-semialdehyde dehydrogenase (acetylating) / methylmalonate-semialdehyde dehydrogenase
MSRILRQQFLHTRSFTSSSAFGSLKSSIRPKAEQISRDWKGTNATEGFTKNFIGGEFQDSKTQEWYEVRDPVQRSLLS